MNPYNKNYVHSHEESGDCIVAFIFVMLLIIFPIMNNPYALLATLPLALGIMRVFLMPISKLLKSIKTRLYLDAIDLGELLHESKLLKYLLFGTGVFLFMLWLGFAWMQGSYELLITAFTFLFLFSYGPFIVIKIYKKRNKTGLL